MRNYNRRIDEEYGDWIVIDLDESKIQKNMNGVHLHYIIECKKCNKRRTVAANDLTKLKKCQKCSRINLINKKFGKVTIIKDNGYDTRYGRRRRQWIGRCECGLEKSYVQDLLLRGDIQSCGNCSRPKSETHPNYNPLSDRYNRRDSNEYKIFTKQVFKRDNYKCIICGSNQKLNAHHLNGWHWYPQGRFDPNNAVTLCGHKDGCHIMFHKIYGKKLNTKIQFEQFIHFQKNRLKYKK